MSSFAEVRIVTERLELREFGPQDATVVKALVAAEDRTSLPPGAPSQRVAEKAGFQREGTLRRAQPEDDGLHDLAVFSLMDDDPGG